MRIVGALVLLAVAGCEPAAVPDPDPQLIVQDIATGKRTGLDLVTCP